MQRWEGLLMSTMERDILISRVVDGLASDTDWRLLEQLAESDPSVWRELALCQRQQATLCGVVDRELECADRVDAPDFRPSVIRFPGSTWKWSGWAAAAMLGLAWIVGQRGGLPATPGAGEATLFPGPSIVPASLSRDDCLQSYLEQGRQDGTVVGQMDSKPVIELRPVRVNGGTAYDVVYARVILERTRLPDVYRLTTDEFGSQMPVRTTLPQGAVVKPPM